MLVVSPPFGEEPWCSEWFKQLGSLQYVRCRHRSVNCEPRPGRGRSLSKNSSFISLQRTHAQEITCKFNSYDSVKKDRLYSGYVLFNAISLIHVLRSDRFKAERIIGRFEQSRTTRGREWVHV